MPLTASTLTGAPLHIYHALEGHSWRTGQQIADDAGLSKIYSTRLLGDLVDQGLVDTRIDPDDPRKRRRQWRTAQ